MAVEVLGVITRVGHSSCARAVSCNLTALSCSELVKSWRGECGGGGIGGNHTCGPQ